MIKSVEMMYGGSGICVNHRLITRSSATFLEVNGFMEELESVDKNFTTVFDIKTMALKYGLGQDFIDDFRNLPVGSSIDKIEYAIIKVSENLCAGVQREVQHCYNQQQVTERNPVRARELLSVN